MGNTLHNKIYLGRHPLLATRRRIRVLSALALAVLVVGVAALR